MIRPATRPRILLYILRRDIRLSDNPIFHHASLFAPTNNNTTTSKPSESRDREDSVLSDRFSQDYTHLLPVYIFPANQVEVSGFLRNSSDSSPYPEARSQLAKVWRTGPHRAKFIADGLWNLKETLEGLSCGSSLEVRVGLVAEVVEHILDWYAPETDEEKDQGADVAGIWLTADEGTEERKQEDEVRTLAEQRGMEFKVWKNETYYVDDKDKMSDLPNVYTTFRKQLEPLRSRPRQILPTPTELPPLPPSVPPQKEPFEIPSTLGGLKEALLAPLEKDLTFGLPFPPRWPESTPNAFPFNGGEKAAQDRLSHLISGGAMSSYKATRNGMLGLDFSTKLSAYLNLGHLTARQVHWAMVDFEKGEGPGKGVQGYGKGENEGTAAVRFELLWRDYMTLCQRKFGSRMYQIHGIRDYPKSKGKGQDLSYSKRWRCIDGAGGAGDDPLKTLDAFTRFRSGRTGAGLIDASNRELFLTGYTSNRARQNVASFLSSHLGIDWRLGAEWYEFLLIDYDVGNNWGNWQYVAGVGNDPRQGRVFNPVKQALDYDKEGEYIKAWVPELRGVTINKDGPSSGQGSGIDQQRLMGLYQAWRLSEWEKEQLGLKGLEWVDNPLVRINFTVGRGRGGDNSGRGRGKGRGRGGNWRGKDFRRMGNEDKVARTQSTDAEF
ncbi:cryptochrome [Lophiostoma macrostomum CBS 122681]|uniref:Cryptochrome DASH n=1 Tax=Lophiostoma macrostomum CBS 122681 TaxID=1314788 RepID=A0A6A6T912_9PLEO|nr:cryptochrome [Lophiostoma macrostomum CBS 122681]